jgi:hypothetical protein
MDEAGIAYTLLETADEGRVGLPCEVDVVAVAPAAGHEPRIFHARHRPADAVARSLGA